MRTPPLVIEFHYTDGDIGAHPVGPAEVHLWSQFARGPGRHGEPDFILIRRAGPDEAVGLLPEKDGRCEACGVRHLGFTCDQWETIRATVEG
jgi:hypothetical protein